MVIVRVSISAGKMDMRLQHFLILIRHLAPLRNLSGSTGPEEDIGRYPLTSPAAHGVITTPSTPSQG
ncbi:hypothetical protein MCOR29_002020 [Pyricularia oryzae]|nr:hypothetical protein MCOR34_002256 [Pyricularia oryzae]KAI6330244.1 hypothetical protein MCOR29_002020 [Pyricularia oryzae]KAI6344410.1 hypothetical protein MCOR30_001235 [Pyricularia oryzae]KAI6378298.1 hypothetical protein MCOR31_000676 [Pyricularia oryzae]KAI6403982.1 hypothetical protein MCOR23_003301 [Pyricularia oryzae]